ncbi:MAG: ActS/PrrB/RegB family redox-sensitive histidine kinase [Candidatus Puniceispirillaceae bacterium]
MARINGEALIDPKAVVLIRWLALSGQSVALICVFFFLNFEPPFLSAFGIILVGVAVNVWQAWRTRHLTQASAIELLLALLFDVIQLAGLLYLTGGLSNPFSILLLAPIVVSAALLDFKSTAFLVILVGVCASLLSRLHLPLPLLADRFDLPSLYLIGLLVALMVSALFISFYVWWLADRSRRTSASLAATQLVLEREQQIANLGALAAAAAHKLGSPLNTITLISHELQNRLDQHPRSEDLQADISLLINEAERCRVILSELDRDVNTDRFADDVTMPISQVLHTMLDAKFTELTGLLDLTTGSLDDSAEPLSKPLPDLKYTLEILLDNAHDYAATAIRLDIGWTATDIDINLSDDGPGFGPNILARLGQPWNSSRDGRGGHRGLGLFLAVTLVNSLGGEIDIYNEEVGGAAIHITIPRERLTS